MIFDRFATIISDCLGVPLDSITMASNLEADLDADSLDSIEILMAVEDEFSIQLEDEEAEKVETVADAVLLIERALA
jgi:acyl carrier protein